MIAYDLKCHEGHTFEGWFDNAKSFEKQQKKALVTCPICGSSQVTRLLSTFGIAKSRPKDTAESAPPDPMEKIVTFVKENFEDVGADFAKEALKMHYGVSDSRNIRGQSSPQEEETLREEGIDFFKIPLPATPASDED